MNDEYLWQKTGSDPDIEKLEHKLAVFRHHEAPLNFPVAEKTVEITAIPRWRISLAFAFAASVIAAVLGGAILIGSVNNEEAETVFVASPELETLSPPPPAADEKKATPAPAPAAAPKVVPQFAQSKHDPIIIRTNGALDRRPKTKESKPATVALTEEEKYAYRQLMLALSISSSKLKLVQDTINGNEKIESTSSTNQR